MVACRNRFSIIPREGFRHMERGGIRHYGCRIFCFWSPITGRVSGIMKTAVLANGVFGNRIDAQSSRAGGSTALYAQGVPLDAIQRWGRWKPPTPQQYLRHDSTAMSTLPEVAAQPIGLLKCLRLMNVQPRQGRFRVI